MEIFKRRTISVNTVQSPGGPITAAIIWQDPRKAHGSLTEMLEQFTPHESMILGSALIGFSMSQQREGTPLNDFMGAMLDLIEKHGLNDGATSGH